MITANNYENHDVSYEEIILFVICDKYCGKLFAVGVIKFKIESYDI